MLKEILLVLIAIGVLATAAGIIYQKASVFTNLAGILVWALVAYGASSIDFIQENGELEPGATAEPAVVVLAGGAALIHIIYFGAAVLGQLPKQNASEKPYQPGDLQP